MSSAYAGCPANRAIFTDADGQSFIASAYGTDRDGDYTFQIVKGTYRGQPVFWVQWPAVRHADGRTSSGGSMSLTEENLPKRKISWTTKDIPDTWGSPNIGEGPLEKRQFKLSGCR